MGSSGESNSNNNNNNVVKEIDGSVGGLVWVRRRNGSWWPGRIMGLDELSESCLVSPRSGTPVKLLGREDASVDWYNLEKSKRVKPFRCGEYNECIERAKASAANASKKAVKYARREDAILHALELESARIGKEPVNFPRDDKSTSDHVAGESPVVSNSGDDNDDITDDLSDSEDNSNSVPELSQSGISFEEPNHIGSSKLQSVRGRRRRTPNDSEDDGTEGVKRMRGLKDLGISVVSKRKSQGVGTTDVVQQETASLSNTNAKNSLANGTAVNGGRVSPSLKRKRSQVANVHHHEFSKRRNRRRPLTKVLESTAMVSVPVTRDQLPNSTSSPLCGISDGKISGLDSNVSKKGIPPAIHNSDSNGVACENGTALNAHEQGCDASEISHRVKENETSDMPVLFGNGSSDKSFDKPFVGDLQQEKHSPGFSPVIVSCSSEKPREGAPGESCHGGQQEALSSAKEGRNDLGCMTLASGHNNISHNEEKGGSEWQSKGKRKTRNTTKNRKQVSGMYAIVDGDSNAYLANTENPVEYSQGAGQKVYCNITSASTLSCLSPSQTNCKSVAEGQLDGLYSLSKHARGATEAKLLPDGSLAPQRSLPYRQSRFTVNSKYSMADFPGRNSDASLHDVKMEVKASYQPQHVPLVSLMSKLNGKAIVGHPITVEPLNDGYCDEMLSSIGDSLTNAGNYYACKLNSAIGRPASKNLARISSSKSSKKKKPALLNKKIRKLSSLTGHRQSEVERRPVVDKFKGPVIACIPLKVVFSRINEALNGQARPSQRVLPATNP